MVSIIHVISWYHETLIYLMYIQIKRASLVAQLVKNLPAMQEALVQFLVGKIPWRRDRLPTPVFMGFLGGSDGKESPAMRETWVWSLGWEDPLKESLATHSSIFAWRIAMDRGVWQATVHRVAKNWTWLSDLACMHVWVVWGRVWGSRNWFALDWMLWDWMQCWLVPHKLD